MTLEAVMRQASDLPPDARVRAVAERLAARAEVEAVLFYGSNLRTGSLDGVLDFYVLTAGARERGIWPTVSYHEFAVDGAVVRAKVATMTLATFAHAASGASLDTTIWARFVQPSVLAWARDARASAAVGAALAAAATTAARYAAALGPAEGSAADYWRALFRATYTAEFRVDRRGRHDEVIGRNRRHFDALLPLAWTTAGIRFAEAGDRLRPAIDAAERRRLLRAWRVRRLAGKPINIARLIRATRTFDGAARYGAWKIERHTGVRVALTPWRERHPVLAAPGVLWSVWRQRGAG